jgi:hypothetical protein
VLASCIIAGASLLNPVMFAGASDMPTHARHIIPRVEIGILKTPLFKTTANAILPSDCNR